MANRMPSSPNRLASCLTESNCANEYAGLAHEPVGMSSDKRQKTLVSATGMTYTTPPSRKNASRAGKRASGGATNSPAASTHTEVSPSDMPIDAPSRPMMSAYAAKQPSASPTNRPT